MGVIKFNNVTKIFTRSHLGRTKESKGLANLSLEIQEGEVFGLLGLNGSGKTTSIKLILGLLHPTEGSIEVLGRTMPNMESLQHIGYLPDAAYVSKYLTGREAIRVYAKLAGVSRNEREACVDRILYQVGLADSADRPISGYSKGMMQRVSMAQAFVHDPDILIMDEPVTGLDPMAIQELRQLILFLKSKGKTVFFSSHNISEVEKVCDRVAILAGGQLVTVSDSKDWKNKEGELEALFNTNVTRTEHIGPLRFNTSAKGEQ